MKSIIYHLASLIGNIAGVEQKLDTYADFYITSYELVTRENVYYEQFELLAKDPNFKDKDCYLVTAIRENGGKLIERKFILNESQVRKIGLFNTQKATKGKNHHKIILDKKITFATLGQYLEPLLQIYPRVQNVTVENASPLEINDVNNALRHRMRQRRFVCRFWGDKPQP